MTYSGYLCKQMFWADAGGLPGADRGEIEAFHARFGDGEYTLDAMGREVARMVREDPALTGAEKDSLCAGVCARALAMPPEDCHPYVVCIARCTDAAQWHAALRGAALRARAGGFNLDHAVDGLSVVARAMCNNRDILAHAREPTKEAIETARAESGPRPMIVVPPPDAVRRTLSAANVAAHMTASVSWKPTVKRTPSGRVCRIRVAVRGENGRTERVSEDAEYRECQIDVPSAVVDAPEVLFDIALPAAIECALTTGQTSCMDPAVFTGG